MTGPERARLAELEDQERTLRLLLPTEEVTDPGAREVWQQIAAILGVTVPYVRPLDEEPIPYLLVEPPAYAVSAARLHQLLAPTHTRPGRCRP